MLSPLELPYHGVVPDVFVLVSVLLGERLRHQHVNHVHERAHLIGLLRSNVFLKVKQFSNK